MCREEPKGRTARRGAPVYETLSSRTLWHSQWYGLRQDTLRDGEGREFTYTVVEHPGSVVILPVTPEGEVVLIRQYRYPVDDFCYEIPAGGLGSDSTPEAAALRELQEEVGGQATHLRYVGWYYPSNGISSEKAHLFLATDVKLGETHREPTESMEIRLVSMAEALRMVRSGEISDGRCALALLWCEPLLR
jgi:ADP-ribose pyrophosphatase